MAGSELNLKDKNEIRRLWKLGIKKRQIARATKVHRNTVSKYIEEFISENSKPKNAMNSIALASEPNWFDQIDWENIRSEYLRGTPLNVLHEELLESNKLGSSHDSINAAVKRFNFAKPNKIRRPKFGRPTPNKSESQIMRELKIIALIIQLKEQRNSLRAIASYLNGKNAPHQALEIRFNLRLKEY